MARSAFETVIRLQLDKFGPEAARKKHIEIARQGFAALMARQQTKPDVTLVVDGHAASSETSVKPFGVIIYRFSRIREVGRFVWSEWRNQAPVESGEYRDSIIVIADGAVVDPNAIPATAKEIIVVATVPYARKIQVRGARLRNVPPGIAERVRQLALRRYRPIVTVSLQYITLSGGYTLKGGGAAAKARRQLRKDRAAGRQLTYPALVLTSRV